MDDHTFRPADPTDPIDRLFCAECGFHKAHCRGAKTITNDEVPLPPEPPQEDY